MEYCPECGHEPTEAPRGILARIFKMPPPPAGCYMTDGGENPSGQPELCDCTSEFHAAHILAA